MECGEGHGGFRSIHCIKLYLSTPSTYPHIHTDCRPLPNGGQGHNCSYNGRWAHVTADAATNTTQVTDNMRNFLCVMMF